MKKQVLLIAVLLMGLTTVTATEKHVNVSDEDLITRYRYAQPIMFVERGVEFMIFPDGSFDFNTHVVTDFHTSNNYYYRSTTTTTRRSTINVTFGAPGVTTNRVRFSAPRDRGVLIQHDRDGKVRRIGNVFINYDRFGKVKRVGSIYMQYNRGNNRLIQVGGLHVRYNVFGELVHSHGQVSHFSNSCGICGISDCNTNHTFGGNSFESDWNDDEDFYYYKEEKKDNKLKLKR